MVTELGQELNSLLAGGNVTPSSTLKKILPQTLDLTTAGWQTWATNNLGPTNQADFARLVLKSAVRQKAQAQENQSEQLMKYLGGNEGLRDQAPKDYDDVIANLGIDENMLKLYQAKKFISDNINSSDAEKKKQATELRDALKRRGQL
jgi:hypothetical protein